jgi:hypothetical protein
MAVNVLAATRQNRFLAISIASVVAVDGIPGTISRLENASKKELFNFLPIFKPKT